VLKIVLAPFPKIGSIVMSVVVPLPVTLPVMSVAAPAVTPVVPLVVVIPVIRPTGAPYLVDDPLLVILSTSLPVTVTKLLMPAKATSRMVFPFKPTLLRLPMMMMSLWQAPMMHLLPLPSFSVCSSQKIRR
jgi:hypothetical protein